MDSVGSNQPIIAYPNIPRTFQLAKTWKDTATSYTKRITRPEPATIVLFKDGVVIPQSGGAGVP
ncbi:hypothetical protein RYX45_24040, partial [Alkalihalophilus pseudofirmus]